MNYINGQAAAVGDRIVSLSNHQTGVVSRTDGEKLQFLTFAERRSGEPFNLIPVTVQERHWEPVGLEVPSETCLPISELESIEATFKQLRTELAEANGARATLQEELSKLRVPAAPGPAVDPNQNELSLPEPGKAQASLSTPNAGATDSAAEGTNGTNNANAS